MEHRTLNLVRSPVFLIFTDLASLRRAVRRKSLISWICLGCKGLGFRGRGVEARVWGGGRGSGGVSEVRGFGVGGGFGAGGGPGREKRE